MRVRKFSNGRAVWIFGNFILFGLNVVWYTWAAAGDSSSMSSFIFTELFSMRRWNELIESEMFLWILSHLQIDILTKTYQFWSK